MGCVHLYCGDGKGKTTAAIGLAVRAAGTGKQVVAARFLKNGPVWGGGDFKAAPGGDVDSL